MKIDMKNEMKNLFIFGAGLSGKAIGNFFASKNKSIDICGTTRNENNFAELTNANITPLLFNGINFSNSLKNKLATTTHLIISIAPTRNNENSENGDIVLPILQKTAMPNLKYICYLSTVGVYGNHDGDWVDETAKVKPLSSRSKNRVSAELAWQNYANEKNLPLAIFRLSGIYGIGRNALQNAKNGKARILIKKGQVFNRIHADDIAKAAYLACEKMAAGIFNITDSCPCPPQDVVIYAHKLLGLEPPPKQDFATADISKMARSFYGENKRVSNKKSKNVLGLEYNFPNYKQALDYMFATNCW